MAMNDFNIGFLAGLDGTKSKAKLNQDIDAIKKSLKELELKAKLDPNQVKALENQLNTLKVNLNNVSIDKASLNNLVSQINNSLSGIRLQIPNLNAGNVGNQAQQVGQQIGKHVQNGINSVIQKGSFEKIFRASGNGINNVSKDAEAYFKTLSNTVSVQERLGNNNNLTSFTVSLKNAEGVAEQLNYQLRKITDDKGNIIDRYFEYSGGSINDNGVIQQMNTISAKADSLQTKLEKLKSSYSDMNASRPIKDSNNISALSQQYDKVTKSIENVRNADSASFSSMVSNAQREITVLENMVSQFRNAENVATQMKSVDISSGIAQAQERLGKLKANASGFDQMKQTIVDLDTAIANVGDKSSLDAFINKLKVAESQLGRVKAETKQLQDVNKIQLSMGVNGDTTSKIELLRNNFTKLGLSADEVKTKMSGVDAEVKTLKSLMNSGADNSAIVTQFEKLQTVLTQTQNNLKQTRSDYSLLATEQQRLSLANTIEAWNQKNTRATKEVRAENDRYVASLRDLNTQMAKLQFSQIQTGFKQAENSMRTLNRLGLAFKDQWIQAVNSFKVWVSASTAVMLLIRKIREMPQTVTALDTALIDLNKTTTMTNSQLEEFYYTSNDVAKQMGVTTEEIINQAAAFSRLGWSSAEAATKMAQLSSLFASISPGMSIDEATTNLTSIIKAYGVEVDDILDGILSKINIVGNNFGTSNAEIAEGLRLSSAAMASLGGTFEENVALFTAGQEIVQDASQVGNAIRSITMRIKGYDETTEEFSEDVVEATGKVADLTKVASNNNMGISMFTDASQTHYKGMVEYLGEISDIWDEIDEKSQVSLLQNLFGKNRAQVGASIIQNFDTVRESLEAMENSAGSADREMSVIEQSLEYKLNRLKETGTGIAQNLFQRDDMKAIVGAFTSIGEAVDFATDKLGLFGTIGLGAGLFAGIKNVGKCA